MFDPDRDRYGRTYGVKLKMPLLYRLVVNAPLLNLILPTVRVTAQAIAFNDRGEPMLGVRGSFRVFNFEHTVELRFAVTCEARRILVIGRDRKGRELFSYEHAARTPARRWMLAAVVIRRDRK